MNQIDLAYLAGVIDSDGCIRVEKVRIDTYSAMLHIQQVEPEAVELAKATFGGYIQRIPIPKRFPNARPMVRWSAKSKIAVAALEALLPYLRIKHAQAENAIALGKLVWSIQKARFIEVIPGKRGPRTRSREEIDSMARYYDVSRHLNSGHRRLAL